MTKQITAEISMILMDYQGLIAKDSLPLERYRLYHLDFGELQKLEDVYFQSYRSFITYVVSLDGFQLGIHLEKINSIHGKFQSVLTSVDKAIKKREKIQNIKTGRAYTKKFWRNRVINV